MARLGCLEDLQVFITGRCGSTRLTTLENATEVNFDRRLDDISEASVVVPVGGGIGNEACCEALGLAEPWCHELHIFRNGEEVWTGVITKITYGYSQIVVEARDVLAWLLVRIPECPFSVTDLDIATVGQTIINLALADDDPCIFENMLVVPSGQTVSLAEPFAAFAESAYDQLATLSELGLSFTTLGRRIIVGGENLFEKTIGLLTDDHIVGEIAVTKDGALYANRVFTRYTGDDQQATCTANSATGDCLPPLAGAACPAISEIPEADRSCYGLVERLVNVGEGINLSTAQQAGDIYLEAGGRFVPRTLEFPPGTRLSADTPFEFNELIPGMTVNVAFTDLCLDIFQGMRLQEVTYHATPTDEEIGITLAAFNLITGGLGTGSTA